MGREFVLQLDRDERLMNFGDCRRRERLRLWIRDRAKVRAIRGFDRLINERIYALLEAEKPEVAVLVMPADSAVSERLRIFRWRFSLK